MSHVRILVATIVALASACSTPPAEPPASPTRQVQRPEAEPGVSPSTRAHEPNVEPAAEPDRAAGTEHTGSSAPEAKLEFRPGKDPCTTDADCVKATCCHADACVSRDKAPNCKDAVCTLECRIGTMDCGGGCVCRDGKCGAEVWMGWDEVLPGSN
jgi:hypothetical protein